MLGLIALGLDHDVWQNHGGLYDIQGPDDCGNSAVECAIALVEREDMVQLTFRDGQTPDVIYADFVRALPLAMKRNDRSTKDWELKAGQIALAANYGRVTDRRIIRDMVIIAGLGENP